MSNSNRLKLKTSELPLSVDLEGPNGEEEHFLLLPKNKKGEIGMFLNKPPGQSNKCKRGK